MQSNRERRAAYAREYYARNREVIQSKQREAYRKCMADPLCAESRRERDRQRKLESAAKCQADPDCVAQRRAAQQRRNDKGYARLMELPKDQRNAYTSARMRAVYRKRSGVIVAARAANICAACGGPCEHMHHVNPAEKEFELAKAAQHPYSEIIREAAKCTCLCQKHHRAVHKGEIMLPAPPRVIIMPEMLPPSAPKDAVELARRLQLEASVGQPSTALSGLQESSQPAGEEQSI